MVPLLQRHHSLQIAYEVGGTKDVVRRGSIGHSQILGLTLLKQTHQLLFLTNINTNTFKCIKFPSDKQLNNVIARIDITKRHAHICCHQSISHRDICNHEIECNFKILFFLRGYIWHIINYQQIKIATPNTIILNFTQQLFNHASHILFSSHMSIYDLYRVAQYYTYIQIEQRQQFYTIVFKVFINKVTITMSVNRQHKHRTILHTDQRQQAHLIRKKFQTEIVFNFIQYFKL